MDAKDLRIGNLLQDKETGTILEVMVLSSDSVGVIPFKRPHYSKIENPEFIGEPIPLTEECLTTVWLCVVCLKTRSQIK